MKMAVKGSPEGKRLGSELLCDGRALRALPAAVHTHEHFCLQYALGYLIDEKLFTFLWAAERDPLFAGEVPDFIREIRRLFTAEDIRDYLDRLENTKYLAPRDPDLEMDALDRRGFVRGGVAVVAGHQHQPGARGFQNQPRLAQKFWRGTGENG